MSTVGKEARKTVRQLLAGSIQFTGGCRLTAGGRDAEKRASAAPEARAWPNENHPIGVPRSQASTRRQIRQIAQDLGKSARSRDFPELALRKKPNVLAVR